MYLGEVTRNVLLSLIDRSLLFQGHASVALNTHYGLDTELMSRIESTAEGSDDLSHVKKILIDTLQVSEKYVSDQDCLIVKRVSELVGTRCARLSAVAIAAIVQQTQSQAGFSVGVDGSLVEFYPRFEARIRDGLRDLLGKEVEPKITIGLAKDGSGVGGKPAEFHRCLTLTLLLFSCIDCSASEEAV